MRATLPTTSFLAVALALAACTPEPTLDPDFENALTDLGGCGDVLFYAVDADDSVLLTVSASDLIADAMTAGTETTTEFTLPDAAITLKVELGDAVSDATCDDVIENDGPQVRNTYIPTAGSGSITVRPGATLADARADLHLEDVTLEPEDGDGDPVELETLDITDVSVGWFAG